MSTLEVNTINPQSGSTITLGSSGNTVALGSGATAGFGKIGQVVQAVNSTYASTTSTSYVDTGITASITPTSTSSKILINISAGLGNTAAEKNNNVIIVRDSTTIEEYSRISFSAGGHLNVQNSFVFLDSPSTTSAITYKLQYKTDSGTLRLNDSSGGSPASTITLMEVLA